MHRLALRIIKRNTPVDEEAVNEELVRQIDGSSFEMERDATLDVCQANDAANEEDAMVMHVVEKPEIDPEDDLPVQPVLLTKYVLECCLDAVATVRP